MSESKWAEKLERHQQPEAVNELVISDPSKQQKQQHLRVPIGFSDRPSIETIRSESDLSMLDGVLGPDAHLLGNHENVEAPQRRGFTRFWHSFWLRQKGVLLVLVSQFFGSCMNLATRILENEGSHGKGMHPIQVCIAYPL